MALIRTIAVGDWIELTGPAGETLGRVGLQRTIGRRARLVLDMPDTTFARHDVAPASEGDRLPHVHTGQRARPA
jgi:hypothetical protein